MIVLSLALLVLIGGAGLIYYSTVYYPQQQRAAATSTAMTNQTNAAITQIAQQTGTAVAQTTQTAQAQATETAQAQATVQARQTIYTQATSGTPAINDPLSSQSSSDWDLFQATDGSKCSFANAALHVTVLSKGYYVPCVAQAQDFGNFALEVDMTIITGEAGGVIFRTDAATDKGYFLRIGNDGYYYLFLKKNGQDKGEQLYYKKSTVIHTGNGQTNTLTIIARDSNFYIYINKQYMVDINDSTLNSGKIALEAVLFEDSTASTTEVAFKNLRVWKL